MRGSTSSAAGTSPAGRTDAPDESQPTAPERLARRNIKLVIAYDGSAYHGWQRQVEQIDTVQQRIERAASRVLGHPVTVFGAGRTDAGVHAAGQVANLYSTNLAIPLAGMRRAINSRLPRDIVIRSAEEVCADFHASRSAVGKTYRYRIGVAPLRSVEQWRQIYHWGRPLDVVAMRSAARRLVGSHDFAAFASSGDLRETTVRTIFRCDVSRDEAEVYVAVHGDGFLYKMVRNIVGTLIEIGRGHWADDRIDLVLASRDRRLAGPTAPPEGLSLLCVHY